MNLTKAPSLPPLALENLKLDTVQACNRALYESVNNRNFSPLEMACRLGRYASRVVLWVRKGEMERVGYHLAMILSWLAAVANRLNTESLDDMVGLFCSRPCVNMYMPLVKLQRVLSERHAEATTEQATLCLAEKILGLQSELEYYLETHDIEHFKNTMKRTAQSFEALCVVASKLGVVLSEEFVRLFERGCPKCTQVPCACGFRTDKVL